MHKLKLATVFSGIGSVEHALIKQNIPFETVFACDSGERYLNQTESEIKDDIHLNQIRDVKKHINNLYNKERKPNYVRETYFANYDIDDSRWYDDIRFIDGNKYINQVDLFVGGSPCQSFSIMGKRAGLDDTRGTLFYHFARLVNEIKPEVFIFENVPGMLTHDSGNTWDVIKGVFKQLDYNIKFEVMDAIDFGIPQRRKRLFVVGFRDKSIEFEFPKGQENFEPITTFLEENNEIESHFYLGKKGFEFVTNPKYKNRAKILGDTIRTQKANQQFNWNGDFVFVHTASITNDQVKRRAYEGIYNNQHGYIRQLTNRECLNLMGYSPNFKIVVPKMQAYRQAGNSIVVNVMEALINEIMKVMK